MKSIQILRQIALIRKGRNRNIEETEAMLRHWLIQWREDGFGYWTVITKENNDIIGVCGVSKATLKGETIYNIYYRTKPSSWKKGYIKEAAQLSIDYILESVNPDATIMVRTKQDNLPSIKIALSLGFKHHKQLDDYGETGDVYYFNK